MQIAIIVIVVGSPVAFLAILSALARKPDNLGVREGKLAPCPPTPNCVCSQAVDAVHCSEAISFQGSANEAMARLISIVSAMPRTRIVTQSESYLHAETASLIFRFVDDVEFSIDSGAGLIHFRSASRVGRSDLGVNRARIESVRRAFANRSENS